MTTDIRITAEPTDHHRCKFVVAAPLLPGAVRRFASAPEAEGSPLAERIFGLPGLDVRQVVVSGNEVTVVKDAPMPWEDVGRAVGQAIRAALATGAPPVAPQSASSATADDALFERVADLFRDQVNPMVARHGGQVELIDVQDATVMLRLRGGCQGCGQADVTLRQGIEGMLAQHVPEIQGIVDITDHSAGENPYYQTAG